MKHKQVLLVRYKELDAAVWQERYFDTLEEGYAKDTIIAENPDTILQFEFEIVDAPDEQ